MDISGKVDQRKVAVFFEQPHLPQIQEKILAAAREVNAKDKAVMQNPNVFTESCTIRDAKKVYIPETIGPSVKERIKKAYTAAGIQVEIMTFEEKRAPAPKTKSE